MLFPVIEFGEAMSPDNRMGLIAPISWLVTTSPWLAMALMFLVTPGGVWIARLIGGRILLPSDEFKSFAANIYFAPAFGISIALINSSTSKFTMTHSPLGLLWTIFQVGLVLLWATIGLLHRHSETPRMNNGQRYSLTSLYHDGAVYLLAGPSMTLAVVFGLIMGPLNFNGIVMRIIVVWCIAKYVKGIIHDVKHPDERTFDGQWTKLDVAHTDHSYPWQWSKKWGEWYGHPLWWWRRYRGQIGNESPLIGRLLNLLHV